MIIGAVLLLATIQTQNALSDRSKLAIEKLIHCERDAVDRVIKAAEPAETIAKAAVAECDSTSRETRRIMIEEFAKEGLEGPDVTAASDNFFAPERRANRLLPYILRVRSN